MFHWFFWGAGEDSERRRAHDERYGNEYSSDDELDSAALQPELDKLDPAITAAILTQAAFRGYRTRERLRRLPAREAERTIRGLHRNADGFRRLGLFLVFYAMYFALVFISVDVPFERSVEQGLRDLVQSVKFGPNVDRGHEDVTSVADLHQWLQAMYLTIYSGTQLEHPCSSCALKPSDDVCDSCESVNSTGTFSSTGVSTSSTSTSTSITGSGSSAGSSRGDETSTYECELCQIGSDCNYYEVQRCMAYLNATTSSTSTEELWTSASNASSLVSSSTSATADYLLNQTALDSLVLTPEGGVSAANGHLVIRNVEQCNDELTFDTLVGSTENMLRYQNDLTVQYDGLGYIATRNRVIGGILVKFARKVHLTEDECSASRGYYDQCLSDDTAKEDIYPGGRWDHFRHKAVLEYDESAGGYPILIDAGGYNTGLNFGYCTLLLMEELGVLQSDTSNVSVQIVTFNGHGQTAYGSILINFDFEDGGNIPVEETIQAYVLRASYDSEDDRTRWLVGLAFTIIYLAMIRHDVRKWFRKRRNRVKRRKFHCCCGCVFYALVLVNMAMWLMWSTYASEFSFSTEFGNEVASSSVLENLVADLVEQQTVADFAAAYKMIYLLTTMAGLYRLIFQMLTFHKRMSIVTDTLSRASTHLDHFLFVFVLVAFVFTNVTWLLVGSYAVEFTTLENAWRSVVRISLGEAENFYPQIMAAQPTVGPLIVVLYQVLGVVLLLNVVIAIILEAYRGVVGGLRGEDTILQSLIAFIGMTLCSWRAKLTWILEYVKWRFRKRRSRFHRPSFKVMLHHSDEVIGVDGRPVLMVRRPSPSAPVTVERQLSYNCPRYISVGEMRTLIEAAPVPTFVADRLLRRIVHDWVFLSRERLPSTNDFVKAAQLKRGSTLSETSSLLMLRKTETEHTTSLQRR